jgi:hypothetical protein
VVILRAGGVQPPLNHVPEGMRLFVLASLELPVCITVCQPRWCPHSHVCLPLRPAQLAPRPLPRPALRPAPASVSLSIPPALLVVPAQARVQFLTPDLTCVPGFISGTMGSTVRSSSSSPGSTYGGAPARPVPSWMKSLPNACAETRIRSRDAARYSVRHMLHGA